MIDLKSLSTEWIEEKRKKYSSDPNLMESMIYALYLLEQIQKSGLKFIFKGGTSLILLFDEPKRFSVDIDIIVPLTMDKETLESHIFGIIGESTFKRIEPDERRSYLSGIPKAHYKFIYQSNFPTKDKEGKVISNPEREILLDILFADNHYPKLKERAIETEWLIQTGAPSKVVMPDVNSIAGDKLTAYAPNTTGIPYGANKEKEIMKQLFDVACLFDLLNDIDVFMQSFQNYVVDEIRYRQERGVSSAQDVLWDVIQTGLLIAKSDTIKNEDDKAKFKELNLGINQFRNFVFKGKFGILEAQVASSKAAYLAAILLKDYPTELIRFDPKIPLSAYMIKHPDYNFLNKRLKFVAQGEALFYWFQTVKIIVPDIVD